MGVSLVGLQCRTSDRTPAAMRGVGTLAPLIGKHLGQEARLIGSPGEARVAGWEEDLASGRGCLLEAGGQVDDALSGGNVPVLLAGDCSIALTTLPTVARHRSDARILWLDAHGDFNTPRTTGSGYLGGMSLAGACGSWRAGLVDGDIDAGQVILAGVRELDKEERRSLERSPATVIGASPVETLVAVLGATDGAPVYVHLDLDVLDPESFPAQFPAPGGLRPDKLYDLLEAVAGSSEIVGLEVTAFESPEDPADRDDAAEVAAGVVEPLLDAIGAGAPAP